MIADVDETMRVFQEEIFGPVLVAMPFDDEAEAVRLANATPYGLAAYVWTNDIRRAHRVAHAIDTGMCWINSQNVRDLRTPFGGVKAVGHRPRGRRLRVRLLLRDRDRPRRARLTSHPAAWARTTRTDDLGRERARHHASGDAAVRHPARRLRRAAGHRPRRLRALLRRPARAWSSRRASDDAVYLRGWEERLHHSLILRQRADGRRVRGSGFRVARRARPGRGSPRTSSGAGCTVRWIDAGSDPGWDARCASGTRSATRSSSFTRWSSSRPSTSASTSTAARRSCASITSTSTRPAWRTRFAFWLELGFRCSEYISTDGPRTSGSPARWLLRKPTVHDVALTAGTRAATAPLRPIGRRAGRRAARVRPARRRLPLRRDRARARAATASPTRSSSICAIRTAIASSCTRATTTPATPTTSRCAGRSTTRAADRSGAPGRPTAGTRSPACCSALTATPWVLESQRRRARRSAPRWRPSWRRPTGAA